MRQQETLTKAITRIKRHLQEQGYQVAKLVDHKPYHLLAYEPDGIIHMIALCRLGDIKRKKRALKTHPANTKIDLYSY